MKQRIYAGWEDRTAELLWEHLGVMTLITDEDKKPIRYEKVYPPIKKLVQNCKKEKIKLPPNPKIKDILLAMVKAGYTNPQKDASASQAIKSLSERVFEKAIKDNTVSQQKVSFRLKEVPPEQEEAYPVQEEVTPVQKKIEPEQEEADPEQEETDSPQGKADSDNPIQ